MILSTIIALYIATKLITVEFLVRYIEANLNCRVAIREVRIQLFHFLSVLKMDELLIGYRDKWADQAIAPQDRTTELVPILQIPRAELKISLLSLLKKRITVEKFMFYQPTLNLFMDEEATNIAVLWQKPAIIDGQPNPRYIPPIALQELSNSKIEPNKTIKKSRPFSIKNFPVSARLARIGLHDGHVNLKIKKTGQLLQFTRINAVIDSIDVHPHKLHLHNSIKLFYNFDLVILGKDRSENARFFLDCRETLKPFLQDSGTVDPTLVYRINVGKSSYIKSVVLVNLLSGVISALKAIGIHLESAVREELLRRAVLELSIYNGRLILQKDANLISSSLDLEFQQGSWLQVTNNEHQFLGSFILYKKESKKSINAIDTFVHSALREAYTEMTRETVFEAIMRNDRIQIPFRSYGNIKHPKVDLDLKIPSLSGFVRGIVRGSSAGAGRFIDKGMDRWGKKGFPE